MKHFLLVMFTLCHYYCHAQNYACLQNTSKQYFINGQNYLRGIRIDSVRTSGTSVTYYPYKTLRGNYSAADPVSSGGSWLGSKVLQLSDGTFIFDNYRHDSILIRTQAAPGDTWTFYNDSGALYYTATVISVDTMTVLGTLDSVKKIRINAYNSAGMVPTNKANGYEILLSKNNGFVQVFDLYIFPYHETNGLYINNTDYYYDKCGYQQIFRRVNFINRLLTDIYNVVPGDKFEYYFARVTGSSISEDGYITDSILSNAAISSTQISITAKRFKVTRAHMPPSETITQNVVSTNINAVYVFDTGKMPEEAGLTDLYYYYPNETTYCYTGDHYKVTSGILFNNFEPCGVSNDHRVGIGSKDYSICNDPGFSAYSISLTKAAKAGTTCSGMIMFPNSVNDPHSPSANILMLPNPAKDILTVNAPFNIEHISIYNSVGQRQYDHTCNTNEATLGISFLPQGIYFVNINGSVTGRFVKQ